VTDQIANRVALYNAFAMVAPGLTSNRETCEQSSCYVLQDGWVYTFNEEIACRAPLDFDGVTGAVPAKGVLEMLDKLPDDDFKVIDGETTIILQRAKRRVTWHKQAEIILPHHVVEMPEEFLPLPPGLVDGCVIAAGCTKKDSDKFLAQCVHLGPGYVEACDNEQVSRIDIPDLDCDVLVRGATIRRIGEMHFTHWALTENWLHFSNATNAIFSCRVHRRDYIDLNQLLDADPGDLLALPAGLQEVIARANVASSLAIGEDMIRVEIKRTMIKITGEGVNSKFEEFVETTYTGAEFSFMASPALLTELAKAHSQIYISTGRLCVKAGGMTYITGVKDV
jgi:hypothetical protein